MNFDDYEFRCHSLGRIMVEPKENNSDLYAEACRRRDDFRSKFVNINTELGTIENTETKSYQKKVDSAISYGEKLTQWTEKANLYEQLKDKPNLSEGCKTHLIDLYISKKYNRRNIIKSKYLEKGSIGEEDAITLYSLATNQYFEKNEHRKSNGWITGEYDFQFNEKDCVFDAKVSWDIFTFLRNLAKTINPLYYWQLQGYMWLWDFKRAKLIYSLINTPQKLIEREKNKLLYEFVGSQEEYEEECKQIELNMTYNDIPNEEKIIPFNIERNDNDIDRIIPVIKEARIFLNNIQNLKQAI